MRWGYLIPRLVVVAIIWAFMTFGFDPLLRQGAVSTLQSATGARVDVSEIRTGFFPPHLYVGDVEVADPNRAGKNLIAFDNVDFHFSGQSLLRRNYVVEDATISGVLIGSDRNDDGRLAVDEDEDTGPTIPPWLTEKLQGIGDEWLAEFTNQIKGQLDPEQLESYRIGTRIYADWDTRFEQMQAEYESSRKEFETIRGAIDRIKNDPALKKDPVRQIEQYLNLAQQSEALLRQSQKILNDMRVQVPAQVKRDYQAIDKAQQNDRTRIAATLNVLTPDSDRITESLLGPQLYLQLQQMLSWVNLARDYQSQLKKPEAPVRARGRTFDFPLRNPTPKYLARKLTLTGHFSHESQLVPFVAELKNLTDDPQLLGQPAVLTAATDGRLPLRLEVVHDATQSIATTSLHASFSDPTNSPLTIGQADEDHFQTGFGDLKWTARLAVTEGQISGVVDLRAKLTDSNLRLNNPHFAPLAQLATDSFASIDTVHGSLQLSGSVSRPTIKLESDLGPRLASNLRTSFQSFVPQIRQQMVTVLDNFVADEKQQFQDKLGSKYQTLVAEHSDLLKQLNQARQIAMDLRQGRLNARSIFSTVSDSGVLSDKDQRKANQVLQQADQLLKGFKNPNKALKNALPRFRKASGQ